MISDTLIFYFIFLQNNLFSRVNHLYCFLYLHYYSIIFLHYYLLHWDLHITLFLHYYTILYNKIILFITISICYDITTTLTLLHYFYTIMTLYSTMLLHYLSIYYIITLAILSFIFYIHQFNFFAWYI